MSRRVPAMTSRLLSRGRQRRADPRTVIPVQNAKTRTGSQNFLNEAATNTV